jgi:tetratricopeptide (TPR) repeat protein
MDASALKDTIPENARAALEPTAQGAQLRRRAIAVGGFGLLVLGFLVVIGLGKLIALMLLLALAGGVAFVVGRSLRRRGGTLRHAAGAVQSAAGSVQSAAGSVQSAAGTAARRPVDGLRTRKTERKTEKRQRDRGKEAGRLNARGVELRRQGDATAAVEAHRAALEIAHSAGDPSTEAMTLNNLALALAHTGDERAAIDHFDASVTLLREINDEHHEGQVLANLGFLHGRNGRQEQAVYCLEAALDRLEPDSRAFRHVQEQLRRAS